MADLYDKIKDSQGLLGKIAGMIPGFSGYMARETRREADKMLRETVANRYGEQLSRISDLQVQLISSGGIDWVDDLQDAATRMQRFIDMVRTAAYGYSGLFDAVKVNEAELAKLYNFDLALLENASKVAAAIDNVEASAGGEGMPAAVRHLSSVMGEANTAYERRKEVLTS
ncbi:MAG: hypothetical protein ABI847_18895 [Anaerolineales bacterium]